MVGPCRICHNSRRITWRLVFLFSSHYTIPAQCWVHYIARGLNSSRSSWVHSCGRIGKSSRCFIVCSSPDAHAFCPSSFNPYFCIRAVLRPAPLRRRVRVDQVGYASLEPGCSDSSGLNESLCGVVWRWRDQRFSLRVRALRCHKGFQRSGGSCVLISVSFWLSGD